MYKFNLKFLKIYY